MSSFSFRTVSPSIKTPLSYTEELDLSGPGVPAGWVAVSTGVASDPTFGGTMITVPGSPAGTSFIRQTSFGLDFAAGVLIDIDFINSSNWGSATTTGKLRILRAFLGGSGDVSVYLDPSAEPEIGLIGLIGEPASKSAIPLPSGSLLGLRVRLSIKIVNNELIARLYVGFNSAGQRSETFKVLHETLGPAISIGTTEDVVEIGNIDASDVGLTISRIDILNASDPDQFYKFSSITSIIPSSGEISGGDRVIIDGNDLDNDLIDFTFDDLTWIISEVTQSAIISVSSNNVLLDFTSAGVNAIAIAKVAAPLSVDKPGGSNVSIGFTTAQNLIDTPTVNEVILFGVEIRQGNSVFALELASKQSAGTIFRIIHRVDSNLLTATPGTIIFSRDVLTTQQNSHTIKLLIVGSTIIPFINTQQVDKVNLASGPTFMNIYGEIIDVTSFITNITSLIIKPLVLFGNEPATQDTISVNKRISITSPVKSNIGLTDVGIRGFNGSALSIGGFDYLIPSQELEIGSNNVGALSVVNSILKQEPRED